MPTADGGKRGAFIVLDGIDGCGKSTQAHLLAHALATERKVEVLHLREPGSTTLGERLREILLSGDFELSPSVETLLFAAARRQMLDERVEPALSRGACVVCERFHPSTFAYQAAAGGVGEDLVLELLTRFAGVPSPNLVIVLEVSADRAAARARTGTDRIESRGVEFQRRVAEGFRRYAERVPGVVFVDADRSVEAVHRAILTEVRRAL